MVFLKKQTRNRAKLVRNPVFSQPRRLPPCLQPPESLRSLSSWNPPPGDSDRVSADAEQNGQNNWNESCGGTLPTLVIVGKLAVTPLPPTSIAPEGTWKINFFVKGPSVRSHVSGRVCVCPSQELPREHLNLKIWACGNPQGQRGMAYYTVLVIQFPSPLSERPTCRGIRCRRLEGSCDSTSCFKRRIMTSLARWT